MRAELLTEGPRLEQRCHLVEEPLPLMDVLPKTRESAWRCDSESHLILFILFFEFHGTREHVSALSFALQGEFTHSPEILLYSTSQKITQFCTQRLRPYRIQPAPRRSNIERVDRNKPGNLFPLTS